MRQLRVKTKSGAIALRAFLFFDGTGILTLNMKNGGKNSK